MTTALGQGSHVTVALEAGAVACLHKTVLRTLSQEAEPVSQLNSSKTAGGQSTSLVCLTLQNIKGLRFVAPHLALQLGCSFRHSLECKVLLAKVSLML